MGALAMLALQLAATGPSIGVAASSPASGTCLAMPAPRLTPGEVITLIRPDPPQLAVTAVVGSNANACDRLRQAGIPEPHYQLGRRSDSPQISGIWIVARGIVPFRTNDGQEIVFRLNAESPQARARSCTSSEGVHLTVWSGEPLKSRRVWHQYFYLGYDVEPTCQEVDTRP